MLPSLVEWGRDDVRCGVHRCGRGNNLGGLRVMGVWGFLISRGVVPVEAVGQGAHHCERCSQ